MLEAPAGIVSVPRLESETEAKIGLDCSAKLGSTDGGDMDLSLPFIDLPSPKIQLAEQVNAPINRIGTNMFLGNAMQFANC